MKIIDKIFRDKKSNTVIYILLAVGILMLVFANSAKQSIPYAETKSAENLKENVLKIMENLKIIDKIFYSGRL